MNDFNSYQQSLNQYQDTSGRTETDEELERMIQESAPEPEEQQPQMTVEHDADGSLQEKYSEPPVTPQESSASTQIQTARDEDREYQKTMFTEATDWVAEKLGFDMDEREQQRQQGAQRNEEIQQSIEEGGGATAVARDGIRAISSGIEKAGSDVIGAANFAGDFAKTKLGLVEEDDVWNNTDHKNYRGSERDLVLAEPRSTVGQFTRDMVSFVTMANKVKAVTGLGKAGAALQGAKGFGPERILIETAAGAVADFLIDPGDGNAANALIEVFPSLSDNEILAAFAHDDDDDEFSRRVKNMVEGGVMGNAVDAVGTAFKGLFRASKPLREWALQNPGMKPSQAPQEIKDLAVQEIVDQLELDIPQTRVKEPVSIEDLGRIAEGLGEGYTGEGFEQAAKDFKKLDRRQMRQVIQDMGVQEFIGRYDKSLISKSLPVDLQLDIFDEAHKLKKLPNGTEIDWIISDVTNRIEATGDYPAYRIDWDLDATDAEAGGLGEGASAIKMYQQFNEVASELPPGSVVQAEAAADGFGSGVSGSQARAADAQMTRLDTEWQGKYGVEEWARQNPDIDIEDIKADWSEKTPEARQSIIDSGIRSGNVPPMPEKYGNPDSIRERLYKRAGLSEPDENGVMYGIVKTEPSGRKRLQPLDITQPIDEQVIEARQYKYVQESFDIPEGTRPGYDMRAQEAIDNGGTRSQPDYEPYERAGKTAEYPIADVIEQQNYNAKAPSFTPGAPSPALTDNTIRQINEAGGETDIIEKAVDELGKEIGSKLRSSDPAVVKQAEERLVKLLGDNPRDGGGVDMSALTELVDEDGLPSPFLRTQLGNKVAKTYMRDASQQISELMQQARQITDTGADANRQYNLAMDRLKAVARLQIRDGSRRGSALNTLKLGIGGTSEEAIKKRVKDFDEKIDGLRERVNSGDPEAVQDMKVFADSLVLADGDPDMAMNFTEKFFTYSRENFEVTMYNSYLSGLVTHERNILGNATEVFLKPAQIIAGSLATPKQARSALSMYASMFDSFREGWRVARTSLANNVPDSISKLETSVSRSDMATKLQNLRASAKTPGENAAAMLLNAQYQLMAAPWAQGATRLLEAADKGFRVVSARQKVKFDMMEMAFDDGIKFDPKKYETVLSTKIKDGDIVDEELLKWAKADTFQEDLGRQMSSIQNMLTAMPALKYVIPFVKTPTNIIKRTAHYTPLLGRLVYGTKIGDTFFKEYSQIMRGDDEVAKAIYKGREGFGIMTGITFSALGFQGLATGAGPRDPELRAIWEQNNRPHSIKVGDTWLSNRFLGPLGILMSMYADIGTLAANRGSYDGVTELSGQLMYTTMGSMLDQSWMRAAFSAMESLNDVAMGKEIKNPDEWQAGILRALTPYQAALRSWNNTLVPGLRDYNNAYEKYLAETLPFAKAFLGAERTSMFTGEPVANGGLSALNQFVPFGLAEVKNDPVIAKMIEFGIDVPIEFSDKYKGVKLTAQEDKALNQITAKNGLRKALDELFESQWFKDNYKAWQAEQPPIPRKKAEWYIEARGIFTDHRNDAVAEYRNFGTPEARAFDQKVQAIEERDFYGRRGDYYGASQAQQFINEAL